MFSPARRKLNFLNLSFQMFDTSLYHLGILLGKNWIHRGRRTLATTGLSWKPVINRIQRIPSGGTPAPLSVTQMVRKPQWPASRVWLWSDPGDAVVWIMGVRLKDLSMWGPPGCILTLEYQRHLFPELVSSSSTPPLKSPMGLLSKNQVENTTPVRSWKCPPLEAQVTAMEGKQLLHGSRVPARGAGSLNAEPAASVRGAPRSWC